MPVQSMIRGTTVEMFLVSWGNPKGNAGSSTNDRAKASSPALDVDHWYGVQERGTVRRGGLAKHQLADVEVAEVS